MFLIGFSSLRQGKYFLCWITKGLLLVCTRRGELGVWSGRRSSLHAGGRGGSQGLGEKKEEKKDGTVRIFYIGRYR